MSNDIRNWAKRQTVGERNAKSVLLEIADVANEDGYSWYAIPTIAATLEASPKTVERGIAYLVGKKIITRDDRERVSGKFTSKGTRINIPAEDWEEIEAARIERRRKNEPTDKMTDGDSPTDILSENEPDQQTICPKPTDKLTNGQNDARYIKNKDVFKTSSETENTNPARAWENPPFATDEAFDLEPVDEFTKYFQNAAEALCAAMSLNTLPNPVEWERQIKWAYENKFTSGEISECYGLLKAQKWRRGRIAPQTLSNNLPELEKLRREANDSKNGNNRKETEADRRDRQARERIEFDRAAAELLEGEGIVQASGS